MAVGGHPRLLFYLRMSLERRLPGIRPRRVAVRVGESE